MAEGRKAVIASALETRLAMLEQELFDTRRALEEAARQEALYRRLVELSPDAMLVQDGDGRIVYSNSAGVCLFGGNTIDDIVGKPANQFVHADSRNAMCGDITSLIDGDRPAVWLEQHRLRLDGSDFFADVSAAPIRWKDGPSALVIIHDVSGRIEARQRYESAEARRQEAHQRLLDAIEAMSEGFALFDADDRLQMYNRRYAEILWGPHDSFLQPGLAFREMADRAIRLGFWDGDDTADPIKIQCILDRHQNLPSESEIRYPRGRWVRQTKKRTRDGGVVATYADITDIKARESLLAQSEENHRALLQSLPDAIVVCVDDRIVFVNESAVRLFGADSADQLIGVDPVRFVPEQYRQLQRERRKELFATHGSLPPVEQKRIRFDGTIIDVDAVATFVIWEGRPAFFGVLRDITERKRTERRAVEAERRFSAMSENLPGAVYQRVLTPDGKLSFDYISSGIQAVTGLTADEIMSDVQPFMDLIRKDFQSEYLRLLRASAAKLTPFDVEIPIRRSDGTPSWLRSIGRPHRRDDGTVVWDGLVTDVTQQKRAEADALQAHHWLLHAIAALPSGFMLWDRDDRLLLWNDRVKSFHPDPSIFVKGVPFEELIMSPADVVRKRRGEDAAEKWLAARRAQHLQARDAYEFQALDDRWFIVTERRTPDGFTVTLIDDITQRRLSEEKRRESDERYRALVNLLPDAVYVHRQGVVVLCNEAALTLFGASSSDDLMGRELAELTHPDYHDIVRQRRNLVVEAGTRTVFMRQKRTRVDGSWFWAEVAAAAIEWEGERGGIVVMRDVTDQIEAEEMLVRSKEAAEVANRTKTEFLANMSHELRTPLNAIIGFSDLMQREMFGPLGSEQYRDYVHDIYQSGTHLHDVINDILDLSKIEAGRLDLNEEEVNLHKVIDRCVRVVGPRADENGLSLIQTLDDRLPFIRGDERKLKQILINLLSNAVKFTEKGGQITLSATCSTDGAVVVTVTDTGVGMAPEEIPQALMPFRQVDSSLSRKHEGTGLGLPLTKSLVELHDGILEIESREGEGTRVCVTLPSARVLAHSSAAE